MLQYVINIKGEYMSIIGKFRKENKRDYYNCVCDECGETFSRRTDKGSIEFCNTCIRVKVGIKSSITKINKNKLKPKVYCCIDGCNTEARYKADRLCQKHYFRKMRYDTFELTSSRKYRVFTPNGYSKLYEPTCELSESKGYVFEHRFVYWKSKKDVLNCEICNKEINWKTVHIDHKDNNRLNNNIENLRPLCNGCNTQRPKRESREIITKIN